ncbi:MAG: chromosome segregation DNA-binding protein [Deltaproteobacteria bacterium]|nr:chromosome segregation DNA-binding protein [Deltaproteobacteria bacterium]
MELTNKRRALGRGLGALIPSSHGAGEARPDTLVPVATIRPNPVQPRQRFADEAIDELAESIRQKGILQPLLVRRTSGGFDLIAGERRLRAAQRLGMEHVPVVVRDVGDAEMLELALIENIQRENLNPIEEARAYRRLIEEFDLTQEEVAARVGKERSTVANTLRLLLLPDAVKAQIEQGLLSAGHARALAAVASDAVKTQLAQEVIDRKLTVRQAEHLAQQRRAQPATDDLRAAEQRLTEALGTRVRLLPGRSGSGRIEIHYYSLDELNGLIDRLTQTADVLGM